MSSHPSRRVPGKLIRIVGTHSWLIRQDTNVIQYELMRCFAKAHGGVSIVGDPDQSVYGWRSAEIENLNRMNRGELDAASGES